MAGKAAKSVSKAFGDYQDPWREKLPKYKDELSKGASGFQIAQPRFLSLKNGTKKTCFIIFTSGSTALSLAQHQVLIYKRPVVIEQVVRLRDFNDLSMKITETLGASIPDRWPLFDMTPEEVWKEVTGEDMTVPSTLIFHRDLTPFFRMLHLIIVWDVAPKHHRSELSFE
ncbi:hypothetical protein CJ030_MR4G020529 [Morella rubra]|uniref:Uncharacterized protein n=1 Tax=Morella rubra TaxID=262757 RepID=A0A6A1VW42_9ROSI|nr:hypothetical protein CJ030_MR4G020529 [Morella rubra]